MKQTETPVVAFNVLPRGIAAWRRTLAAAVVGGLGVLAALPGLSAGVLAFSEQDLAKLLNSNKCAGCDLSEADLGGADLGHADFQRAWFLNARFNGADLAGAILKAARFEHFFFGKRGEQETAAGFDTMVAIAADFSGADLRRTVGLTQAQLDESCGDSGTSLPAGLSIEPCPSKE